MSIKNLGLYAILLSFTLSSLVLTANAAEQQKKSKQSAPFELKGTKLGMTFDDFKNLYSTVADKCSDESGDKVCHFYAIVGFEDSSGCKSDDRVKGYCDAPKAPELNSISGCDVGDWYFTFVDSKLEREEIMFDNSCFTSVKLGFSQKFGKPSSIKSSKVVSGGGASFSNSTLTWKGSDGLLILVERDYSINLSSVVLVSHSNIKDRSKKLLDKSANDL